MMIRKCAFSLILLVWLCGGCDRSGTSKPTTDEIDVRDAVNEADSIIAPSVIYRSSDFGRSWMPYANGIPPDATVSSFWSKDQITYATTDQDGVYSIKEGDGKWVRVDQDLPEYVDINAITSISNLFIIGTFKDGIFISRNGGRNWEQSADRLSHTPIRSLLSYNNILLAGTDDGIYKSTDLGASWKHLYKGVQTNGFTVLNSIIYAALMNGAIMTTDEGANWKYIYKPHALHDISNDGENVYAMTLGGGLLKSKDDGLTWENVNNGFGVTKWYTFEVKHSDNKLFAAQWHGIYSMDKNASTWQIIKNGLPDSTAFSTLETTPFGLIAGIGLRKK
jgi:photosystem II stability/assembly factor-like uncharacterized protein